MCIYSQYKMLVGVHTFILLQIHYTVCCIFNMITCVICVQCCKESVWAQYIPPGFLQLVVPQNIS